MVAYLKRRQVIGIGLLLGIILVLMLALAGLFRTTMVQERRTDHSHVVRIVRDMNGYRIYWAGSDTIDDIVAYDVQVCRIPCEAWRDWKIGISETSAWFGPDEGKHFGFRVRAHGSDGLREPWSLQASMTTEQASMAGGQ